MLDPVGKQRMSFTTTITTKMWLVNVKSPDYPIREVEVKVVVCKKTVWAELPNKQRKLIGSTIFQSEAAAKRCQFAHIERIVKNTWLARNPTTRRLYESCHDFAKRNQLLH